MSEQTEPTRYTLQRHTKSRRLYVLRWKGESITGECTPPAELLAFQDIPLIDQRALVRFDRWFGPDDRLRWANKQQWDAPLLEAQATT